MSNKDTLTKKYLANPDIFADAFNYFLFGGKQVIKPDDLQEQDSTELAVIRKMDKLITDQKHRDILKLCTIRRSRYATLVLLGIEGQDKVNYVMPVRDNLYDALNYSAQVSEIRRQHKENGDITDGAELLSGFTKEDKLIPVITLCICFDKKEWDAPKSLSDMFGEIDPRLKPYINDYKLNLITPGEVNDFTKFASGLGLALEFIQNSDDKDRMRSIIESREEYKSVDVETVDIINVYTNAGISKKKAKGDKIDMCTAIKGLIEDGRIEGRAEGIKEEQANTEREKKRADEAEAKLDDMANKLQDALDEIARLKAAAN